MRLDAPYQETDRISPHWSHYILPLGDGAWRCLTCDGPIEDDSEGVMTREQAFARAFVLALSPRNAHCNTWLRSRYFKGPYPWNCQEAGVAYSRLIRQMC